MPHTDFPNQAGNQIIERLNSSPDIFRLHQLDDELVAELHAKTLQKKQQKALGQPFQNEEIAHLAQPHYTQHNLKSLETFLVKKGTFSIPIASGYEVTIDGNKQPISFVAATEINSSTPNHGDMSSMLYLRDHIQAAGVLMELSLTDPAYYKQEGKDGYKLLISALSLMSTPAQLKRFENVIKKGSEVSQEDWPHISLLFEDLQAEKPNGWRNKQDTFQMLAYLTCDAIERGFLDVASLAAPHRKFLGLVAPLLKAAGFPAYESSGSWEEITANRTSVMVIETALLYKIRTLAKSNDSLKFLYGDLLPATVDDMIENGLQAVGHRLPFESPDYTEDSIKYRRADAALTYVLMYDIPKLLAAKHIPIGVSQEAMSERAIEDLVLKQLATLTDPQTNGMRRYDNDSYQRNNFHTNEVQVIVRSIKQAVQNEARGSEIDLDKKQRLRDKLTPQGREASWTHPLGQLSAWAARSALESLKESDAKAASHYTKLSTLFLNRMLSTITGDDDWHAVLNKNGLYSIQKVPAFKLPECYAAYQTSNGDSFTVPSPHTPLNWSSAMLKEAVGLLRAATVLQ